MATAGNPKDSFKSTWKNDRSQWGPAHYLLNILLPRQDGPPPVYKKTDPVPVLLPWSVDLWILVFASWPLVVQNLYIHYVDGAGLPPVAAFLLYSVAYQINAIHQVRVLSNMGQKYGYLDGDHPRDQIPDVGVGKAVAGLLLTTNVRPLFTVWLSYSKSESPLPTIWLPVELFFYSVVLDFFFYIYHRSCHEVDFLWKYHRTHHLTKHPNAFLSAYADHEQELLEIAVIPILTFLVVRQFMPMTFYDWWFCQEFVIFAEAMGHSGLRVHTLMAGTSKYVLGPLGCDLVGEDHDLHHRRGYRKSFNYGKQTKLWDRLFNTCGPRYEFLPENMKDSQRITFPFW